MISVVGAIGIDAVIMEVAGHQAGVCTRAQLLDRGLGSAAIGRRITAGLLRPTLPGVYLVPGLTGERTPLHRAIAAVPRGELSRRTAGRLLGHPVDPMLGHSPIDVAAPHGFSRRIDGLSVHVRRRPTPDHDLVMIDGLPVTGPAMTIVDLAAVVGPARLRHLVRSQIAVGNPTLDELVACFDSVARRGVNGIAALRRVLEAMVGEVSVSSSVLEAAVARLLVDHHIHGFEPQYRPPWYDGRRGIVDFAHPEMKIVLEADGRQWHRREEAMTEDRRRDRAAVAHGWVPVRVTWHEVMERPAAIAAELEAMVTGRRVRLGPAA